MVGGLGRGEGVMTDGPGKWATLMENCDRGSRRTPGVTVLPPYLLLVISLYLLFQLASCCCFGSYKIRRVIKNLILKSLSGLTRVRL